MLELRLRQRQECTGFLLWLGRLRLSGSLSVLLRLTPAGFVRVGLRAIRICRHEKALDLSVQGHPSEADQAAQVHAVVLNAWTEVTRFTACSRGVVKTEAQLAAAPLRYPGAGWPSSGAGEIDFAGVQAPRRWSPMSASDCALPAGARCGCRKSGGRDGQSRSAQSYLLVHRPGLLACSCFRRQAGWLQAVQLGRMQ